MKVALPTVLVTLALTVPASAEGIYRWTDENGQVHYTDRKPPSQSKAEELEMPESEQGWESMLDDESENSEKMLSATEKAINSLELERIRTEREHRRVRENYEETKADLAEAKMRRVDAYDPGLVADLKVRQEREWRRMQRLSQELAEIDAKLERLKALKKYGQERTPKKKKPVWQ